MESPTQPPAPSTKAPAPLGSAEAWFDSLQPPAGPPPRKQSKKLVLLTACLVMGAVMLGLWWFNGSRQATCLTTDDYQALTGASYTGRSFSPTSTFYSYTVQFGAGTASYIDTPDTMNGSETITTLANFYTSHLGKSIIFTIESDALSSDPSLATERIAAIARDLRAAGVPESSIVASAPTSLEAEAEAETVTTAIVSITSAAACK